MGRYQHLIFDLDHTLWDFDANASQVLKGLHDEFIAEHGFSQQDFIQRYTKINADLWRDYHAHRINKQQLREQRFPETLRQLGISQSKLSVEAEQLEHLFLERIAEMNQVFPHCHRVLEKLSQHFTLHIMTNGFEEVQHRKMKAADLDGFFQEIFISELIGANKPSPKIFEHAIDVLNCGYQDCLMIGDNIEADVGGAMGVGMDQVWFNPEGLALSIEKQPTYEVSCLSELLAILLPEQA